MRVAVTGANGQIGWQVVELLTAGDVNDVVALCRRPLTHDAPSPRVTAASADYTDLAGLRSALRGVDTLVFVSSDGDVAKVMLHHRNVVRAATDAGVAHVVALSGLDADVASPFCYATSYGYTEELLYGSGMGVSVARASIFTEFFMTWLTAARGTGQLRLPTADARISLVSRRDVGRCLAALATDPPTGRHHDLTGPAALDLTSAAAVAADTWATPITSAALTPAEHLADMTRAGEDPWWMYAYSTMFASIREHRWSAVTGEVARLTGAPPRSLRDVLAG